MYIHRIVIDANRINTRNDLPAMNRLEQFHDANIVELLRTSTLAVEFAPWKQGLEKALKYTELGGHLVYAAVNNQIPDSQWGSGRDSRFVELNTLIFGPKLHPHERTRV